MRCPGQDQRYWKPEDIFDLRCPYCGYDIEFWKDEPIRMCKGCSREIRNPRINLGCAKWCQNADACLGRSLDDENTVAAPVVERLAAALEEIVGDEARLVNARTACSLVDDAMSASVADPLVAKAAAFVIGAAWAEPAMPHDNAMATLESVLERAELTGAVADRIRLIFEAVLCGTPNTPESRLVIASLNLNT